MFLKQAGGQGHGSVPGIVLSAFVHVIMFNPRTTPQVGESGAGLGWGSHVKPRQNWNWTSGAAWLRPLGPRASPETPSAAQGTRFPGHGAAKAVLPDAEPLPFTDPSWVWKKPSTGTTRLDPVR